MKNWKGRDFYGSDLESHSSIRTVEECVNLCLKNSECVAFTYAPEPLFLDGSELQYSCWLKKDQTSWTVNESQESLISGHKCGYNFNPIQTARAIISSESKG